MTARLWWLPSLLLLLTITTLLAGEAATANDRNDSAAAAAAVTGGSGSAVAQTLTAAPISSEQELLNWALAHSNPDALRQAADEARRGAEAGTAEFVERQALLEALKSEPTEAELMKVSRLGLAIAAGKEQLHCRCWCCDVRERMPASQDRTALSPHRLRRWCLMLCCPLRLPAAALAPAGGGGHPVQHQLHCAAAGGCAGGSTLLGGTH